MPRQWLPTYLNIGLDHALLSLEGVAAIKREIHFYFLRVEDAVLDNNTSGWQPKVNGTRTIVYK